MRKAVLHLKKSDAVLASIIERVGPPRITYREPTFEALARAIVFQQLSTKAARTIYGRVEEIAGSPVTPEGIQNLELGEMRRAGLSKQKIGYLRDLADHALSGSLDFNRLPVMSDPEVIATLTAIKGVGLWTAQMFLIFALRRPDVLAVGDLGVRTAIKRHYRKRVLPKPTHIEKLGANWRPYSSFACWYLWRSLELPDAGVETRKTASARRETGRNCQHCQKIQIDSGEAIQA